MSWALAAKLVASLGCALLLYGVWAERVTTAWVGWGLAFVGAEGLGILLRATLSGHVWALYALPVAGAAAIALVVWLPYHLAGEHFLLPRMKPTWWDDVAVALSGFVSGLLLILRGRRER